MASLYRQRKSKFWWIKYRDAAGVVRRSSTKYRIGFGPDTRKAQELRANRTLEESRIAAVSNREPWDVWVNEHIDLRYVNAARTHERVKSAWRTVRFYLMEREVSIPRQLTRDHCVEYMEWRRRPDKKLGKYNAGHNTALLEIKMLSVIMGEAVMRGYAPFNPCRDLHIKKAAQKVKPALTPEAVRMIREKIELKQQEDIRTFLRVSFEIAYHHGVRLNETYLNPMERVEFLSETKARITFSTKGARTHTVMLHPNLIPMFKVMIDNQQTETYKKPYSPSKQWHKFMSKCGVRNILPDVSFHSTRVNAATILARAGVSEKKAMAYLGHASTTVHRTYVRLRPEDLSDCSDAIS